jgi:phospho-N-acetylmuramoyl-pentapeptide-transferase
MIPLFLSSAIAAAVALAGSYWLARVLRARGRSQPILQRNADNAIAPEHQHKAGTPTMGGLAILGAALSGYLISHVRAGVVFSNQTLIVFGGVFLMGGIGLIDDVMKVRARQNRGLFWKFKGVITLLASFGIAAVLVTATDIDTRVSLTRADLPGWELGTVGWTIWAGVIIFCTANAVNVTDGLDGLASGTALFGFLAFAGIAYAGFRTPQVYGSIVNPYDLAVFSAAFAGACVGFLWMNAAPALIFMGDVGALAIGTALALLALTTNTHLLLPLICGLNVLEIGSVALQMGVFRASGRKRRLFRISPVHHHFELVGWPETRVIIRFWLIAGLFVAVALGIYVADFTEQVGG